MVSYAPQVASVNYDEMIDAQTLIDAQKELNDLNSERDRLEQEVQKYKTLIDESTKKYNDAKAEYEKLTSSTTVDELNAQISSKESELTTAQKNLEDAQAKLDEVSVPYNEAVSKVTEAENAVTAQQSKIDGLTVDLAVKEAEVASAQTAFDTASANYNEVLDPETKTKYEGELATAQANLTNLQAEKSALDSELVSANQELTKANTAYTDAQAAATEATNAYNEALAAYNTLSDEVEELKNMIPSLQSDKTAYEKLVAEAKAKMDQAQSELDALTAGESDAQKLYNTTKAAYEAVVAQWNKGSLGFFESNNDQQAQDILAEGQQLGTTTIGNYSEEDSNITTYDATYLENMKICVDLLSETNRLRELEGLSPLQVSDTMMAIAQVKANASAALENFAHTGYYKTNENLTLGYAYNASGTWSDTGEKIEGVGPYMAWYGIEKRAYEEALVATNEDGTLKYPQLRSIPFYQLSTEYPDLFYKVGHYLCLKVEDVTVQGLGFNKSRGLYNDAVEGNPNAVNGVFALEMECDLVGLTISPIDKDKTYNQNLNQKTVSKYVEDFYTYYDEIKNKLVSTKEAYDKAKAALESTTDADLLNEIAAKQGEVNVYKAQMESYQKTLDEISANLAKKVARQPEAQKELDSATVAKDNAYQKEADKLADVATAEEDLAVKQGIVDNKQIQIDGKAGEIKTAQATVDGWQSKIDNYDQLVADYKKAMEDAQEALTEAGKVRDGVSKEKAEAESAMPALNQAIADAKAKEAEVKVPYDMANDTYKKSLSVVNGIKTEISNLTGKRDSILSNKQTMDLAKTEISRYEGVISNDKKQIVVINDKIAMAQKNVSELTETIEMHRLYNMNSGEHFYTSSASEKNHLVSLGWKYEGIGWNAPKTSDYPVYRLYNGNGGEHHYTMSASEKNMLVNVGWSYEGIGWYSADPNSSNSIPLLREYNPNAFANNHNYTTSKAEHDWLVSLGWKDEGKAWYAINK